MKHKRYRIAGTDNISTKKGATFDYELFETDNYKDFTDYINTHAV
jgi:hypothetical protein